ncbi:MAG: aspartyl/asparaginyl beta-hydroxylase domain-containing protein [Gammaproteobacteria bacterium]
MKFYPTLKKFGVRLMRGVESFQSRHSLVGTAPVLDNAEFPWIGEVEAAYPAIRDELTALLEHPERIPTFHQLSPDQERISKGDNWKVFTFHAYGTRIEENRALCPATSKVIDRVPGLQNAWFSILAPGYHIPPHHGPTRAVVRLHLGLIVPQDGDACWIRVDDQICHWQEGKALVFDDTYEHEVRNDTPDRRVVLFLDFDRPMDRIGTLVNRLLVFLIRISNYVQVPLKNLADWNSNLQKAG